MASKEVWDDLFHALDSLTEDEFDQTLRDSGFDCLPIAVPVSMSLRFPFSELFAVSTTFNVSWNDVIPAQKKKNPLASFAMGGDVFASNKSLEAA